MTENNDYTDAEQKVLDSMKEKRGEEYVEENASLILTQANLVGNLDEGVDDSLLVGDDPDDGEDDTSEKMAESAIERIEETVGGDEEGN